MSTSFPLPIPNAPTGFVTQAALDAAFTIPINDLAAVVNAGVVSAASGTITITPSAANVGTTATVTFPAGRFAGTPLIFTQPQTGPGGTTTVFTWPTAPGPTGFTMNLNRSNTTATAISWLAIDTA